MLLDKVNFFSSRSINHNWRHALCVSYTMMWLQIISDGLKKELDACPSGPELRKSLNADEVSQWRFNFLHEPLLIAR